MADSAPGRPTDGLPEPAQSMCNGPGSRPLDAASSHTRTTPPCSHMTSQRADRKRRVLPGWKAMTRLFGSPRGSGTRSQVSLHSCTLSHVEHRSSTDVLWDPTVVTSWVFASDSDRPHGRRAVSRWTDVGHTASTVRTLLIPQSNATAMVIRPSSKFAPVSFFSSDISFPLRRPK